MTNLFNIVFFPNNCYFFFFFTTHTHAQGLTLIWGKLKNTQSKIKQVTLQLWGQIVIWSVLKFLFQFLILHDAGKALCKHLANELDFVRSQHVGDQQGCDRLQFTHNSLDTPCNSTPSSSTHKSKSKYREVGKRD